MKRFKTLGLLAAIFGVVAVAFAANYPYYLQRWTGMGSRNNTTEFSIQVPSSGAAAILAPGTTNTNALGSSSLVFSNVYSQLLTVGGTATVAVSSNTTSTTTPFLYLIPNLDVTVTTPTIIGQLGSTSAGKLYISTATQSVGSWKIVGTQS